MKALVVDDSAGMRKAVIGALGRPNLNEVDHTAARNRAVHAAPRGEPTASRPSGVHTMPAATGAAPAVNRVIHVSGERNTWPDPASRISMNAVRSPSPKVSRLSLIHI